MHFFANTFNPLIVLDSLSDTRLNDFKELTEFRKHIESENKSKVFSSRSQPLRSRSGKGSIARARQELSLTQPAIRAQIQVLEEALGEKLFARAGQSLAKTGRTAFCCAEEIFSLERERAVHELDLVLTMAPHGAHGQGPGL